jgi:tRNA A-37 threonylcarbamoyl transferase component Bud32
MVLTDIILPMIHTQLKEKSTFTCLQVPYQVITFLRKGKSGYSYIVSNAEGRLFVAKFIHEESMNGQASNDTFTEEINAYAFLKQLGVSVPELIAYDLEQEIIIKQFIQGPTILELIQQGMMDPLFISKMKDFADFLKNKNINIDYHPSNFIIRDGFIYYLDYEYTVYQKEYDFDTYGMSMWR